MISDDYQHHSAPPIDQITTLKVPPHSLSAEQAVIGAILLDNTVLADVDGLLDGGMFYRREHRILYEAIIGLYLENKPVDVIMLSDVLADAGQLNEAGGLDYLAGFITNTASAYNAAYYANTVREKYLLRTMIAKAHSIVDSAYNGPESVQEKIDSAQAAIMGIDASVDQSEARHIKPVLKATIAEIEHRYENRNGPPLGLQTGFADLDRLLCGMEREDLIVIAGVPGSGKSSLAQNIIEHNILAGEFVIFFSVEMPSAMVSKRHLSSIGKIQFERIRTGRLENDDWDKMSAAAAKMVNRDYYIEDAPGLCSTQLLSKSRRIMQKTGKSPSLIVIDYLQRLGDKHESPIQKTTEIVCNAKTAARMLKCPVILLSQLNRQASNRPNKRPLMTDLKESSSIEQEADVILMLYRDELYNEDSMDKGIAEVIIRKQRNGPIGTVRLASRLDVCRFENLSAVMYTPRPERQRRDLE